MPLGEEGALRQRQSAVLHGPAGRRYDARRFVFSARNQNCAAIDFGGHRKQAGNSLADRVRVVQGQRFAVFAEPGNDRDAGSAQLPEGVHDSASHAFAQTQHCGNRKHPDDDAQQRESGARLVAPQGAQRRSRAFRQRYHRRPHPSRADLSRAGGGIAPPRGGARVVDHAAVEKLDAPVRVVRHGRVVGDQDYRASLLGKGGQSRHDLLAVARIHRAGGLVRKHHLGPVHQRPRNRHALLLAARHLAGMMAGAMRQAQRRKQFPGSRPPRAPAYSGVNGGHLDIFLGRGHAQQVVVLEHEAECFAPQAGPAIGAEGVKRPAPVEIFACARPVETADQIHQRGFAGARRTHHRHELAGVNFQRDVLERVHFGAARSIPPGDVPKRNQRRGFLLHQPPKKGGGSGNGGCGVPVTTRSPSDRPDSTSTSTSLLAPTRTVRVCSSPSAPTT